MPAGIPQLVDTHCHLDFKQFAGAKEGVEAVLARAAAAGVTRVINVGTSVEASKQSVALAERFDNVWAAAGVHPYDAGEIVNVEGDRQKAALDALRELAYHERVVAIGEIGFDFHRPDNPPKFMQGEAFMAQAEIADAAGLPLIVHFRGSDNRGEAGQLVDEDAGYALACLSEYADKIVADNPLRRWPGVIHCYTGDLGDARELLEMGYLISFTAPVTYAKNDELREVVKALPLEKIMVETDAPFLPPVDQRGKRNEPAFVVETAKAIAEIKGVQLEAVAEATTANAERLFGLGK